MKTLKYVGSYPITHANGREVLELSPQDEIRVTDEMYERSYRDNPTWEIVGNESKK